MSEERVHFKKGDKGPYKLFDESMCTIWESLTDDKRGWQLCQMLSSRNLVPPFGSVAFEVLCFCFGLFDCGVIEDLEDLFPGSNDSAWL